MTIAELNSVQKQITSVKKRELAGYVAGAAAVVAAVALGVLGAHGVLDPVYGIMSGVGSVIFLGIGIDASKKRKEKETEEENLVDRLRGTGVMANTLQELARMSKSSSQELQLRRGSIEPLSALTVPLLSKDRK